MPSPVVTVTTDFGTTDAYVAAMKGVALDIFPDLTFVDVTHEIPPQDIGHAAFVLGSAYPYFPPDAIHLAVVDPGVGTQRRAVLLVTPEGRFVGPDNGIFSYALKDHLTLDKIQFESMEFAQPVTIPIPSGCRAYELTNPRYWHHPVSSTFHGRDVFAPVAAHLASGVQPESFGESLREVNMQNLFTLKRIEDTVEGKIIHVDRFGNLVSNIPGSFSHGGETVVELAGVKISGLSRTFGDADALLALVGSHGYVEIAENRGNAARRLGIGVGGSVVARWRR